MAEFMGTLEKDYPDLSTREVREVVETPFKLLRSCMKEDNLESVRLKYFGSFLPYAGTIAGTLKTIRNKYEKGELSRYEYQRKSKMCNDYLNDIRYENKEDRDRRLGSVFAG